MQTFLLLESQSLFGIIFKNKTDLYNYENIKMGQTSEKRVLREFLTYIDHCEVLLSIIIYTTF